MVRRGGFSFVAMLVINPVVILFYQNCAMTPMSQAYRATPPPREVSSVSSQATTPPVKPKATLEACAGAKASCTSASVE